MASPPGLGLQLIMFSGPGYTIPLTFRDTQKTDHELEYRDEYFGRNFIHLYDMELWPKHVNNLTFFFGLH